MNPLLDIIKTTVVPFISKGIDNKHDIDKARIQAEEETKREEIQAEKEKQNTFTNASKDMVNNAQENLSKVAINGQENSKKITMHGQEASKEIAIHSMTSSSENIKLIQNTTDKANQHTLKMIEKEKDEKTNFLNSYKEENKKNLELLENMSSLKAEVLGLKIKEEIEKNIYTKLYDKQQILSELQKENKKLTFEINQTHLKIEPFNKELKDIETDLKINDSHFIKENNEFEKKIEVIKKLIFDYKDSMDKKEYETLLKREKRELKQLDDNLSNYEYKMLNSELKKLTKEKELTPIKNKLQELEKKKFLISLELENEQNQLLSPLLENNQITHIDLNSNIIDVEIESSQKRLKE